MHIQWNIKFRYAMGYCIPLWVLSALSFYFIAQFGLSVLALFLFVKVALFLLIKGWSVVFRKQEIYYYANLGIAASQLWWLIAMIDLIVFLIFVTLGSFIYYQ